MRKMSIFFFLLGGIFPHLHGFPQMFGGRDWAAHTWWRQHRRKKEGEHFWLAGNTGVIIQGNSSAGDCFVQENLIKMNFSK